MVKRIATFMLVLILAAGCFAGCSNSATSRVDWWPTTGAASLLPALDVPEEEVYSISNSNSSLEVDLNGITSTVHNAYAKLCKEAGFDVDSNSQAKSSYKAYDSYGNYLSLDRYDYGNYNYRILLIINDADSLGIEEVEEEEEKKSSSKISNKDINQFEKDMEDFLDDFTDFIHSYDNIIDGIGSDEYAELEERYNELDERMDEINSADMTNKQAEKYSKWVTEIVEEYAEAFEYL